jgi:hypothetical protein
LPIFGACSTTPPCSSRPDSWGCASSSSPIQACYTSPPRSFAASCEPPAPTTLAAIEFIIPRLLPHPIRRPLLRLVRHPCQYPHNKPSVGPLSSGRFLGATEISFWSKNPF